MKSRIKECEKKDKECAEAWTKEVKMGGKPKDAENETEVSEDLKELSGSGRLKDLISSCSERDAQKEKSWESAKQKVKCADEEEELRELASLSETRSKIIQQVGLSDSNYLLMVSKVLQKAKILFTGV